MKISSSSSSSTSYSYSYWRMNSAHSPTFSSLHLRHRLFSNLSVALPMSQVILQPFRCFTYVTAHSPAFFRFSYVTGSSLTSPGEPPMLWFMSNIFTSHVAGLGSITGRVNFLGEVFPGFSLNRKTNGRRRSDHSCSTSPSLNNKQL